MGTEQKISLNVIQDLSIDDLLNDSQKSITEIQTPTIDKKLYQSKEYVSYSELNTWVECSWRHKLKYLDKINLDGPSEHTEFGQVMHDAMESYLKTKTFPDNGVLRSMLKEKFDSLIKTNPMIEPKLQDKDWANQIDVILNQVPDFLDITFPGWEYVTVEEELLEPIEGAEKKFKGYIDGVIKVPKKKQKKDSTITQYEYVILDHKTCSYFWNSEKRQDQNKQMQLVLYKHYYALKHSIPEKDIKCAFLLLSRSGKERCCIVPVSVGPVLDERVQDILKRFINTLKKNYFIKNYDSCKYCVYRKTEHCPTS